MSVLRVFRRLPSLDVGLLRTPDARKSAARVNPISKSSVSKRIVDLRKRLKLSQAELGRNLGSSAMAVSRWERGQDPGPGVLIKLGILGGQSDCWFFWTLAGLTAHDVTQVLPGKAGPVKRGGETFVIAGPGGKKIKVTSRLVPVPVLPLQAAANKEKGSSVYELEQSMPENVLAAPSDWCPNPSDTISLRVKGDSMQPLLQNGYLVAVDRKQNKVEKLEGEMLVAHHNNFGLVVSRLYRINGHRMLVPDNRSHEPVHFDGSWRVIGKVLWWLGVPHKRPVLGS